MPKKTSRVPLGHITVVSGAIVLADAEYIANWWSSETTMELRDEAGELVGRLDDYEAAHRAVTLGLGGQILNYVDEDDNDQPGVGVAFGLELDDARYPVSAVIEQLDNGTTRVARIEINCLKPEPVEAPFLRTPEVQVIPDRRVYRKVSAA